MFEHFQQDLSNRKKARVSAEQPPPEEDSEEEESDERRTPSPQPQPQPEDGEHVTSAQSSDEAPAHTGRTLHKGRYRYPFTDDQIEEMVDW